jgi:hypothetical protein
VKIIWVGLSTSALTVAAIVVYGFLFGLQSHPAELETVGGDLYFPLIAMLGGALAAILLLRWSRRGWFALRDGVALGSAAGAATGVFLLVWQLLFGGIVNLVLQRPGLFFNGTAHPHPLNSAQLVIVVVAFLVYTSVYSFAEGVAAVVGGALAGSLASVLSRANALREKPSS